MPDVVIDRIDPKDSELLAHLFNQMFRPPRDAASFTRRFEGRAKILAMGARVEADAVGFYVGFELKPSVHFAWLCGVVPEMRRMGIATQLMHAAMDWSRTEGYRFLRFECHNQHRPFLHFGIANDFDIVGMRWDPDLTTNLVIFERSLRDE